MVDLKDSTVVPFKGKPSKEHSFVISPLMLHCAENIEKNPYYDHDERGSLLRRLHGMLEASSNIYSYHL